MVLLSPRQQAGILAPRALLSSKCLVFSSELSLPCMGEGSFSPPCKSIAQTQTLRADHCTQLRKRVSSTEGLLGYLQVSWVKVSLPSIVLAQLMWLRLCCRVAL